MLDYLASVNQWRHPGEGCISLSPENQIEANLKSLG